MLVPAILYKEQIQKEMSKRVYSDEYFYYIGAGHTHPVPNLELEDGRYEYAIIDSNEKLLGYFSYRILWNDSIDNIGIYSFDKDNPVVTIEVYREICNLVKQYRRIEWRVISGNPAKKIYDKFCKKFNGTRVKLRDCAYDNHGALHDEYIYEILKEDWS